MTHGTLGGYTNYRCPCAACREAYRLYRAAYRARKRAGIRRGSGIYGAEATRKTPGRERGAPDPLDLRRSGGAEPCR